MKMEELRARLLAADVPPSRYGIGRPPEGYEGFALLKIGNGWEIVHYEKGDATPWRQYADEETACDEFYDKVLRLYQARRSK